MDSVRIAAEAVTPLSLTILAGIIIRRLKWLNPEIINGLDRINFRLLLPLLMFSSMYSSDFRSDFSSRFLIFVIGVFAFEIILWFVVVPIFEKEPKKQGTLIQAMFRSNTNVIGTAVISQLYNGQHIGLLGASMLGAVPLPQIFGIVALERCCNKSADKRTLVINILKNPMIIGTILSIIVILFEIELPHGIESTIKSLSGAATPLSLISLGASLEFPAFRNNIKDLILGTIGKAIVHPLLILPPAIYLGFRGPQLATIMIVANAPVGISVFSVTKQMGGDEQLAAQLIVVTTVLSIFGIFLSTFLLSFFELI